MSDDNEKIKTDGVYDGGNNIGVEQDKPDHQDSQEVQNRDDLGYGVSDGNNKANQEYTGGESIYSSGDAGDTTDKELSDTELEKENRRENDTKERSDDVVVTRDSVDKINDAAENKRESDSKERQDDDVNKHDDYGLGQEAEGKPEDSDTVTRDDDLIREGMKDDAKRANEIMENIHNDAEAKHIKVRDNNGNIIDVPLNDEGKYVVEDKNGNTVEYPADENGEPKSGVYRDGDGRMYSMKARKINGETVYEINDVTETMTRMGMGRRGNSNS